MFIKICIECNKSFSVYRYRKDIAKFCSWNCSNRRSIVSDETRKKMSFSRKGLIPWNKGTKGVMIPWNKGKHHSEIARKKMSIAHLGKSGQGIGNWKDGRTLSPNYNTIQTNKRRAMKKGNGGYFSTEQWKELKERYGFMCLCCKNCEPAIKLEADHIIPLSVGGSNDISNIQPLCRSCNTRKQTKIVDYRIEIHA